MQLHVSLEEGGRAEPTHTHTGEGSRAREAPAGVSDEATSQGLPAASSSRGGKEQFSARASGELSFPDTDFPDAAKLDSEFCPQNGGRVRFFSFKPLNVW